MIEICLVEIKMNASLNNNFELFFKEIFHSTTHFEVRQTKLTIETIIGRFKEI